MYGSLLGGFCLVLGSNVRPGKAAHAAIAAGVDVK